MLLLGSVLLTLLESEAGGPLLQGDVLVVVRVALLEEAGGAVLHGNERGTQGGELRVGQVSVQVQVHQVWALLIRPGADTSYVPVLRVLVQLPELPVDGEDVHVVVLLEVVGQQVQRVIASLQPLLVLVDLLDLREASRIQTLD